MEQISISTDLLVQRLTDNEIVAIVKYQILWGMLEHQPDDKTTLRYLTQKQLTIAKSYQDSIKKSVTSEIDSVNKKRTREKKYYEKQKVSKNSNVANTNNIYKENSKKESENNFQVWWKEYPRKVSKIDAQKSFEKIIQAGQASFDELLQGAKQYAEYCREQNTEEKYIKHPSTWLNQGCWSDEHESDIIRVEIPGVGMI